MKAGTIKNLMVRETSPRIILEETETGEKVVLDERKGPFAIRQGAPLEVFVYRRDQEHWIGSPHRPFLLPGQIGTLEVVGNIRSGTFLDWGLAGDLFLPVSEQRDRRGTLKRGHNVLVGVTVTPEQDRVIGTLNIYDLLSTQSPYARNDSVDGIVYELNPDLGAFVAVNSQFHGMIPQRELYEKLHIGQAITGRVNRVREDGRLELSLRMEKHEQMDDDSERILKRLIEAGGRLPLHDRSDPEDIRREMQMSKAAFKRALGRLWKNGQVILEDDGIRLA